MYGFEPAMRVDPLVAAPDLIDFDSPLVSVPDYQLLTRLERERRLHLDLGLDREACGIGFAMLMIWQVAMSRQPQVDIPLELDLQPT